MTKGRPRSNDASMALFINGGQLPDAAKDLIIIKATSAEALHKLLLRDGTNNAFRPPRSVGLDVRLPFSYTTWARKLSQKNGPYDPSQAPALRPERAAAHGPDLTARVRGGDGRLTAAGLALQLDCGGYGGRRAHKKEDSVRRHKLLAPSGPGIRRTPRLAGPGSIAAARRASWAAPPIASLFPRRRLKS